MAELSRTIHDEFEYVKSMLINHQPEIDGEQQDGDMKRSCEILLFQACSLALTDILEMLLPHIDAIVWNADCRGQLLYDCVTIAYEKRQNDVIRILLEFACSRPAPRNGDTSVAVALLHCAASMGDIDVIAMLTNIGVDVNQKNSKGETTLHFACNTTTAEFLLNNGAIVNATNNENKTPLYYACASYRLGVIRSLLDNGAKPNIGLNFVPERVACEWDDDRSIVAALLQALVYDLHSRDIPLSCCWTAMHGDEYDHSVPELWEGPYPFCRSCKNENQLMIQEIKAVKAVVVGANNPDINAPLHSAISEHHRRRRQTGDVETDGIKLLLSTSNPINVNALDISGTTALYLAVENNLIDVATLLLDSGADPNLTTSGKYPLIVACRYLSHEFVELLLDRGADPNVTDSNDRRPLTIAARSNDFLLVKLLIEHGADVNHRDRNGATALHSFVDAVNKPLCRSSEVESFEVAKFMINSGFNINQVNARGESVLSRVTYRISHGIKAYYQLFELLLQRGADTIFFNSCDETITQHPFVTREYLRRGGDPNRPDKHGRKPLAIACKNSSLRCARILLAAGADPNSVTWDALVCASEDNNIQLIDLLLNSGARFDVPNEALMCFVVPPEVITFCEFYIPLCIKSECIVRLFKAGSNLKTLSTCCRRNRLGLTPIEIDCPKAGRLCQAIALAGYSLQGKEELIELLRESARPHALDLASWLEEDSMTPPSLLRLSRTVIRRQLSAASGCRTILPLIEVLPITKVMRLYLKFEGPFSEIDLSVKVRCDSCGQSDDDDSDDDSDIYSDNDSTISDDG